MERPDFCIAADDPIIAVAKLIISLGVPVDAVSDSSNPPNTTPLQIAIKNGDVFFAQFLLSQGAQLPAGRAINTDLLVSASSVGNTAGLQSLLASHVDPNTADYQGNYALPEALSQGQYAVAKQLIDAGEDPNLSGPKQPSALNTTASRNLKDESALLISKGADINKHDSLGQWPLRSATRSGSLDVMAQLISLHADVNALDPSGNSVLHNLIWSHLGADEPNHTLRISPGNSLRRLLYRRRLGGWALLIESWGILGLSHTRCGLLRENHLCGERCGS